MISSKIKNTGIKVLKFCVIFHRQTSTINDVHLSNIKLGKKIKLGESRFCNFFQFDTLVQLSDGSVIKRTSQAPKNNIKMIHDQRNNYLWNKSNDEMKKIRFQDESKISKFKKKFKDFDSEENFGENNTLGNL